MKLRPDSMSQRITHLFLNGWSDTKARRGTRVSTGAFAHTSVAPLLSFQLYCLTLLIMLMEHGGTELV